MKLLTKLDMKTTRIALYKIFRRMGVSRDEISLNTDVKKDLFFDSAEMNIFLYFLETKFKINILDREIAQLQTIGSAINYIDRKTAIQ